MSRRNADPRQLDLFDGRLPADDPVATYYRRLRRAGLWLALDPDTGQVHASSDSNGVPAWAKRGVFTHRDRIKSDVMRGERSIVRSLERGEWPCGVNYAGRRAASSCRASRSESAGRHLLISNLSRRIHSHTDHREARL